MQEVRAREREQRQREREQRRLEHEQRQLQEKRQERPNKAWWRQHRRQKAPSNKHLDSIPRSFWSSGAGTWTTVSYRPHRTRSLPNVHIHPFQWDKAQATVGHDSPPVKASLETSFQGARRESHRAARLPYSSGSSTHGSPTRAGRHEDFHSIGGASRPGSAGSSVDRFWAQRSSHEPTPHSLDVRPPGSPGSSMDDSSMRYYRPRPGDGSSKESHGSIDSSSDESPTEKTVHGPRGDIRQFQSTSAQAYNHFAEPRPAPHDVRVMPPIVPQPRAPLRFNDSPTTHQPQRQGSQVSPTTTEQREEQGRLAAYRVSSGHQFALANGRTHRPNPPKDNDSLSHPLSLTDLRRAHSGDP